MTAISRPNVKIAIVAAGTNGSAIASTDYVLGEIKSYSKTGGEWEFDSDPVFGGYINKQKAVSQMKLEFDVRPSIETPDRWDALIYNINGSGIYALNTQCSSKAVFIQALVGSSYKSWGFNNCQGVTWEMTHNADDIQTGKFTFKLSPLDTSNISNFVSKAVAITALPAWSTLTSP